MRARMKPRAPTVEAPRTRKQPQVYPAPPIGGRARAALPAAAPLEGEVRSVDDRGVVQGVLTTGETVAARCPAHVDRTWLKAAVRAAPVEALFVTTRPSGRFVLWAIFPGEAHDAVAVDVRIRGRQVRIDAESVQVGTDKAQLRLDHDGNVSLRGRDVTSRASRVNRIKGGAIRLN